MLHGKNFSGSHKSGLATVFDGDDGGLESDDGFSAADIALKQAIHGHGFFYVCGNFREDTFLGGGGLERQHFFQGFTDAVFAQVERDGVGFPGELAIEREAELVEEKFFEDEALLRGRAELIERVHGFASRREVSVNDSVAPRRKF